MLRDAVEMFRHPSLQLQERLAQPLNVSPRLVLPAGLARGVFVNHLLRRLALHLLQLIEQIRVESILIGSGICRQLLILLLVALDLQSCHLLGPAEVAMDHPPDLALVESEAEETSALQVLITCSSNRVVRRIEAGKDRQFEEEVADRPVR